jgi:sugar phosphate isomerase/epimerase
VAGNGQEGLEVFESVRPPLTVTDMKAREEIRRSAGTQFDPAVVESFLMIPLDIIERSGAAPSADPCFPMPNPLALHTWTLDTTPLGDVLRIARKTGWEAVELRRIDFARAREAGRSAEEVLAQVGASGLAVTCIGVELGWMFAEGAERRRLLAAFSESCAWAAALGCSRVMSPVDRGQGDIARAAASIREVGDVAAAHGVRLALEMNFRAEQFNTLSRIREVLARAGDPHCGLLVDTYHLQRSGGSATDLDDLAPEEIAYVQYSDAPASGLPPGVAMDRLPPGRGVVPFAPIFRVLLGSKGYAGPLSYEAPNPTAWARDPEEVAREALAASRAVLPE